MKTQVTVASITEDLDRIAAGAEANLQFGAAKGAVETKAKLHGLLVDRKETGAPGEFAGQQSEQGVLDMVRNELGEAAAQALSLALSQASEPADEPAAAAVDVVVPAPTHGAGGAVN